MITQIDLDHFKCFRRLRLPLAQLTLLSGANASGKSTVIQSLVLLHQTMLDHEWSTRLQLNGPELQLGTVGDVVDQVYGRRTFHIGLIDSKCTVGWEFDYGSAKQDMSVQVMSVEYGAWRAEQPRKLRYLLPEEVGHDVTDLAERLRRLTYVTAERVGPRETYQLRDPSAMQVVGPRGENAVGLLHLERDHVVLPQARMPDVPPTLYDQVEARMRQFFPGMGLNVQQIEKTNIVTLGLRTSEATDYLRPNHVGFGLTQILPIVVAALFARPNDLLLIENPEVHLHPAGQARMGHFLAQVSSWGVQVIVESHSDHILNGIRRAVKKKLLAQDAVALHFFRPRDSEGEQVMTPSLDPEGRIDHWPDGFFDQFDKDLNYFAGWGE